MFSIFILPIIFINLLLFGTGYGKIRTVRDSTCEFSHTFESIGQSAFLQSPNYPEEYPPNADCTYYLESPPSTKLNINCDEFNVEPSSSGCLKDKFFYSLTGDHTFKSSVLTCGSGNLNKISKANQLAVKFQSNEINPMINTKFRFKCKITVVPKNPPSTVKPITTTTVPKVQHVAPKPQPAAPAPANPGQLFDPFCACGVRNDNTRIVNGFDALVNEFPWHVGLYNERLGQFCGGTIISNNFIITAAHCTEQVQTGEEFYVDAGDHDITSISEAGNILIKIQGGILEHFAYNNKNQDNDIAIIKLPTPLNFTKEIQPICLPWAMKGRNLMGSKVVASGWGKLSHNGGHPEILQKVELNLLTGGQCMKFYGNAITNNMICTLSPGKDTCQGDSGGSIDLFDQTTGKWTAIGVVSWGVGCAVPNKPGVYTFIPNYLGWILQNTKGETYCKP